MGVPGERSGPAVSYGHWADEVPRGRCGAGHQQAVQVRRGRGVSLGQCHAAKGLRLGTAQWLKQQSRGHRSLQQGSGKRSKELRGVRGRRVRVELLPGLCWPGRVEVRPRTRLKERGARWRRE